MKAFLTILTLLISFVTMAQDNNILIIDFDGIKTNKGKLFVALYDSEVSFLKKAVKGAIVEIENGKAKATFENLEKGIYAVSSFYDKNDNGKMDTNFFGIPKEPTGLSNNAKGSFGPPKFKDAKFNINTSQTNIKIKFK